MLPGSQPVASESALTYWLKRQRPKFIPMCSSESKEPSTPPVIRSWNHARTALRAKLLQDALAAAKDDANAAKAETAKAKAEAENVNKQRQQESAAAADAIQKEKQASAAAQAAMEAKMIKNQEANARDILEKNRQIQAKQNELHQ